MTREMPSTCLGGGQEELEIEGNAKGKQCLCTFDFKAEASGTLERSTTGKLLHWGAV